MHGRSPTMRVLQCQTFVIHVHRPSPHYFIVTHSIKIHSKDKRAEEGVCYLLHLGSLQGQLVRGRVMWSFTCFNVHELHSCKHAKADNCYQWHKQYMSCVYSVFFIKMTDFTLQICQKIVNVMGPFAVALFRIDMRSHLTLFS